MKLRTSKRIMLPASILLASAVVSGTYVLAQVAHQSGSYGTRTHVNLSEQQSYIRDCRDIISTVQAEVYVSSDLQNGEQPVPIQTLAAGTQVRLTGVLRKTSNMTAVQIYLDGDTFINEQSVGWVRANKLTQTAQFCRQ